MGNKNKIQVIVNKHFQVEPFIAALMALNREEKLNFPMPTQLNIPTDGTNRMNKPRASYRTNELIFDIDVWCIEDLMPADANGSNSEEKYKVLPQFFYNQFKEALTNTTLVISVSTAESTNEIQEKLTEKSDGSINGSVLFGNNFFMLDVHSISSDPDPYSGSYLKIAEDDVFKNRSPLPLTSDAKLQDAAKDFWIQNKKPDSEMKCVRNNKYMSIGVVNVTDYNAYKTADPVAHDAAMEHSAAKAYTPVSIETTHGIVDMAMNEAITKLEMKNKPYIEFVSPITDRYGCFDDDVGTTGLQNYIAGYNAGIAVGHFLKLIDDEYKIIPTPVCI